jgi:hypothetical protein
MERVGLVFEKLKIYSANQEIHLYRTYRLITMSIKDRHWTTGQIIQVSLTLP